MTPPTLEDREQRLEQILGEYFVAQETGQAPSRAELMAAYPNLADDIARFFENFEMVDRIAEPVRPPDVTAPGPPKKADEAQTPTLHVLRAPASSPPLGRFGDYELLEEVARGGMGVVYKARQVRLNRIVALKMILFGSLASRDDVSRFHAEAQAVARLEHPNIVPIHEVGEHDGRAFFSMRFIDGPSLAKVLAAREWPTGKTGETASAQLVAHISRAVHYAHQRGILHRDLKPGNILLGLDSSQHPVDSNKTNPDADFCLLTTDYSPFVTDFGLAKRLDVDSNLTQSGAIVGTPNYMAPEQALGNRDLTTAADIHSLGAVLYELLTGRRPFEADGQMATVLKVQFSDPPPPRSLVPTLNRDLETICLKCLRKNPAERYGSAEALAEDLERWLAGEPILARRMSVSEHVLRWIKRRPAVAALIALMFLTNAVGFCVISWKWLESEDRKREAESQRALAEEMRDRAKDKTQLAETARFRAERLLYAALLSSAVVEWQANRGTRAEEILASCDAQWRSWEWFYLERQIQGSRYSIDLGRNSSILDVANESFLVKDAKSLRLYNLRSESEPRILAETVLAAHCNSDGKTALLANDRQLRRWKVGDSESKFIKALPRGTKVFSGDGQFVAVSDGTHMFVHRTADGSLVASPKIEADSPIARYSLNYDGSRFALSRRDGTIEIWNHSEKRIARILKEHAQFVDTLQFNKAGDLLLSNAPLENLAIVWNLQDGTVKRRCKLQGIFTAALNSQGSKLVLGLSNKTILLHDVVTGDLLQTFRETAPLALVRFSPDGQTVVSQNTTYRISTWSTATDLGIEASGLLCRPTFSPDSKLLAGHGKDGAIAFWNPDTLDLVRSIPSARCPSRLSFNADGSLIAVSGQNGGDVIRLADGHSLVSWKTPGLASFDPNGNRLARYETIEREGFLSIADAPDQPPTRYPCAAARDLSFSPDGRILALAADDVVHLIDPNSGREVRVLRGAADSITSVAWSPDGQYLAANCKTNATVWNAFTGDMIWQVPRGGSEVAFSPDGKRVVLGDNEGNVAVCDAASGQTLLILKVQTKFLLKSVGGVAFSSDGRWLVANCPHANTLWDAKRWHSD